jgi:cytochrome b6-f complex iron-sulfur subunit
MVGESDRKSGLRVANSYHLAILQRYPSEPKRPCCMQTISRKEFISLVGSGVGAAFLLPCLSSCGSGGDPAPATTPVDETLNLADTATYADLLSIGWQHITIDNTLIIVAQTGQNAYAAVSATCTHEQERVIYRADNNRFFCPRHSSAFTTTGAVVNGPATQPLRQYTTTFNAANKTLRITG